MNTHILMVTYSRDACWAYHSLRSVEKFATGFSDVRVLVPNGDVPLFRRLTDFRVMGFDEPHGKGMVAHMAQICQADLVCPNADAILHLDADTIFWRSADASEFFVDGKPTLYRELFENFRECNPTRYGWKETVRKATGIDPDFETMVRHCAVHLAPTYGLVRKIIERHTGMNWKDYILSCKNSFPQFFAEFPTIGAVALEHANDKYNWVDYSNGGSDYEYDRVRDATFSFWSHGGLDAETDRHPGRTAREMIEEILG